MNIYVMYLIPNKKSSIFKNCRSLFPFYSFAHDMKKKNLYSQIKKNIIIIINFCAIFDNKFS